MSQSASGGDAVPWGPPPASEPGTASFGACAVGKIGRPRGVRIMLKDFAVMTTADGPVAYFDVQRKQAVQIVQALRQAIDDAALGRNLR